MHINDIQLNNFKLYKNKAISFNTNFSLIIGDNGVGKTSILEALCVGLGGFLAGISGVNTRNIHMDEVRISGHTEGDATYTSEPQFPCSINCTGQIDGKSFSWKRSINNKNGRTDRINAKKITKLASDMQRKITQEVNKEIILPIISYQGAGRLYSQKREKWTTPFEKGQFSRLIGYTDCLEAESNIKLFVDWFRRMKAISLQRSKEIGELYSTRKAISTFMQNLSENGETASIDYDFEKNEVVVDLGSEELPLRLMSSGYRSIIGMVADIAFRMSLLNPQLRENAAQRTPGVVLIDELDLHLHPKWQWRIIEDLKKTFPCVQFIATTHSPILIASCEEGEVIDISDESKHVRSQPYGWQVADVLSEIMGTSNRTLNIENDINLYEKLYSEKLNKELNDNKKRKFNELESKLLAVLPERDPALTLTKLNAIRNEALKANEKK
ncbi:MAG: AAA family ATPase [Sporolactobacillus sp.]